MIIKKKSLGQNFIYDKNFLKKISNFISSESNNTLIEIGPGPGTLTEFLFKKKFRKLILIEKDQRLISTLTKKFLDKNVNIINIDALEFEFEKNLIKNSIIVGNLPFNISVELLYKWTKTKKWPPQQIKMVLMFQKEVADRIIALPNCKAYGKLSVVVQSRYIIKKLIDVPSVLFTPAPKVDGTILEFMPLNEYKEVDINKIDKVAKMAFSQRRKKIKNNLNEYIHIIKQLDIDENLRAENLSILNYCNIARLI
ncbi:16S rRNA (adenine(1518)-N(6)/adenine(1519)-N(6))-dimethyltransferase RsmA [Pelagibacterales bacterium]|nr:16S rRNA (adenine(1518)-N(6)/adenine(1519)-N(6))-dimethyltransferase RsmA [Pelagibacterales bacterium]